MVATVLFISTRSADGANINGSRQSSRSCLVRDQVQSSPSLALGPLIHRSLRCGGVQSPIYQVCVEITFYYDIIVGIYINIYIEPGGLFLSLDEPGGARGRSIHLMNPLE